MAVSSTIVTDAVYGRISHLKDDLEGRGGVVAHQVPCVILGLALWHDAGKSRDEIFPGPYNQQKAVHS